MTNELSDMKIAILVTDGFELQELTEPRKALQQAGAITHIISPKPVTVRAWDTKEWGDEFAVDIPLNQASATDYDALLLPGGVIDPDHLRMNPDAVEFVQEMVIAGKPVAAICHGPWTLIDANGVHGRTMTSWPSLKTDLINAGAKWVDQEVVTDGNFVTSRKPSDIPAFNSAMIKLFSQARQHA